MPRFSFERSRVDAPHDDALEHRVRADPPHRPLFSRWLEVAFPIADRSLAFPVALRTPSIGSLCPTFDCHLVTHRRSGGDAGLARIARSATRWFPIRESAARCSGMSDVVSCVREFRSRMCLEIHLRWLELEAPCPFRTTGRNRRSRQRERRLPEGLGSRSDVLAEHPNSEPEDTSDRRLQPTYRIFKDEHPRLVMLPEALGRTSLLRSGEPTEKSRSVDPLRRAAQARRRRCLTRVDRSGRASDAPSPIRSKSPKTVRPDRPRFVLPSSPWRRDGYPNPGRLHSSGTPKGIASVRAFARSRSSRSAFRFGFPRC